MKNIFLTTLCLFCGAVSFAQIRISVNNLVEIRAQQDAQETGSYLSRLRDSFDVNITSSKFDLWYRARLNIGAWGTGNYSTLDQKIARWFLPGLGDAQIRAIIRPTPDLVFGIGSEIVWDLGPISLWDDDIYHVGYGKTYRSFWDFQNNKNSGVRPSWTNADNSAFGNWERARRPQRFAYNGLAVKYSLFGAEVGFSIPFQDLGLLTEDGKQDNFGIRWGAKYTIPKVFSVGVGWASTLNMGKNPWSFYIGGTYDALPTIKPEVFFSFLHRGLDFTQDLIMQTNFGARVRLKFQDLTVYPEFAVSIDSLGKDTSENNRSSFEETYLAPFFVAVPIGYKISNLMSVQLWVSFATGDKKAFLDVDAEYKPAFDYRVIVRPGIDINHKFGVFRIQIAGIMEGLHSMQQPLRFGYLLNLAWTLRGY